MGSHYPSEGQRTGHETYCRAVRAGARAGGKALNRAPDNEAVRRTLAAQPQGHRYLLPDVCLSDEGRFLDGLTIADLPRVVEIIETDGIALRAALEQP